MGQRRGYGGHLSHLSHTACLLGKKPGFGLLWWCSGWESACQYQAHGFNSWSRKIPHVEGQLSPWTATTKPHSRAHELQLVLLKPVCLEPTLLNKRNHSKKDACRNWRLAPLAAIRESLPTAKNKTEFKKGTWISNSHLDLKTDLIMSPSPFEPPSFH